MEYTIKELEEELSDHLEWMGYHSFVNTLGNLYFDEDEVDTIEEGFKRAEELIKDNYTPHF